jgi:hypothetical protein
MLFRCKRKSKWAKISLAANRYQHNTPAVDAGGMLFMIGKTLGNHDITAPTQVSSANALYRMIDETDGNTTAEERGQDHR